MKLQIAADLGAQKAAAAVAAASGVTAAWFAGAQELATALFGVPLPVIMAAAIGAFGAQSFMKKSGYLSSLAACVFWTLAGTACSSLGLWIATFFISKEIPPGAMTGAALVLAGGGRYLFQVDMLERVRAALARWIDNIGRSDANGNGKS